MFACFVWGNISITEEPHRVPLDGLTVGRIAKS
jgi:hypothetical protein